MLNLLLTPLLTPVLALCADPVRLESKITDVTLYADTALVTRRAQLPGSGLYLIAGLPARIDRDNVRVKCNGGDVIDVQVRERSEARVPDQRLEALRARVHELTRARQGAEDELAVLQAEHEHLQRLLKPVAAPREAAAAKAWTPEAWNEHWQFAQSELARNLRVRREATWKVEEAQRALASAQQELGQLSGGGAILVCDALVEIVAGGPASLELGYFVPDTGWQPVYDLRTAADLSKVALGYRARIGQQSGEDWNDVALALSTAQPQRGAQGPDPDTIWLSVVDHDRYAGLLDSKEGAAATRLRRGDAPEKRKALEEKAQDDDQGAYARVESQGLSVRFQLAGRETVLSRREPTTVLVGAAELAITPERHCVPALDPTVWLRARARNTSDWVLLPGTAAVFFGADYFGEAAIGTIHPGQELTLHLGADPTVTCKREQIEDTLEEPGLFSSRASKIDSWKVHFENHGSLAANADGSIDVIVRESLPKPRDERVQVKLTKSSPAVSDAERWKQDRAEKGLLTWIVRVPKAGSADLVWQSTVTYPHALKLVRN